MARGALRRLFKRGFRVRLTAEQTPERAAGFTPADSGSRSAAVNKARKRRVARTRVAAFSNALGLPWEACAGDGRGKPRRSLGY